jgi:transposase
MQNFHNDAFEVEQVTTRFLDEYTKVYFDLQEDALVEVLLGVDTHLDCHVAVALDELGRRLGELTMPTTTEGYESLLSWAERFGPVRRVGLEGTGSYAAGLAQHLKERGVEVLEVERPPRGVTLGARANPTPSTRRERGQSGLGR